MNLNFKEKVVLITGAGRGMGQKIALQFAKEGASLVLNDLKEEFCEETAIQVSNFGTRVIKVGADVSCSGAVKEMFERVKEEFNRVDVLVNNAGVLKPCNILDLSEDEWDSQVAVNLKSVYLCSRQAARIMKEQEGGVIANASSFSAVIPSIGMSAYSAAKAAVANLTRTMAGEFAPYNIRVFGYIPGVIETRLTRDMRERNLKGLVEDIALHRCGKPEEVARIVVFLCSDAASYFTGGLIEISGGKYCVQNAEVMWK